MVVRRGVEDFDKLGGCHGRVVVWDVTMRRMKDELRLN